MKNQKTKPPFNKSQLRSSIRRVWMWSELRKQALARARLERGVYQCEGCGHLGGPKEMDVNHKQTVTPENGLNTGVDWGEFIHRLLYCGLENLEVLCKTCHAKITAIERAEKKAKSKPKKS